MNENNNAILLTWNLGDASQRDGEHVARATLCPGTTERYNYDATTNASIGDRVFVIRFGIEPRGIIAMGVLTMAPTIDTDSPDVRKEKRYIEFRVDEVRESCTDGLLPMALLTAALPTQNWSNPISGNSISKDLLPTLEDLWHAGKGKHSLRQFAEWQATNTAQRNDKWLASYRDVTSLAFDIREKNLVINDEILRILWKEVNNGLASVAPGAMSADDFNGNKRLITRLTEMICYNPDADTMQLVLDQWNEAKKHGTVSKTYHAVIRRVFAAAAPERYTTIINPKQCRQLLDLLHTQFQLLPDKALSDGWASLNEDISYCMQRAGLNPKQALQNNIAMWRLLASPNDQAAADNEANPPNNNDVVNTPLMTHSPLNQILYGPPGTGKTHSVVNEALRILDPDYLAAHGAERAHLVTRFNHFRAEGQVVFCTFHQSFSYEDFVEGLRAVTENGAVNYRIEEGVFKKLCTRAKVGRTAATDPFDQALKKLKEQLDNSEGRMTISTAKGNKFSVEYDGGDIFQVFPQSSAETQKYAYSANMNLVRRLYQTGSKEGIYNISYVDGMLKWLREKCGLPPYQPVQATPEQQDKFVLIIDEINRGNISRIFGELITLIEPSKRAGTDEALEVTLPYSKLKFSVPQNVYLVGTMNTADRSLASLDIALRRRFTFVEMPPRPNLIDDINIEGVNIGQLLRVMNERIELLLDRDHCLGHAYFMPLHDDATLEQLAFIFRQQIVPLLQEYFFEDWERIAWVLNDQNKTDKTQRFVQKIEANLAALFGADTASNLQNTDRRWRINPKAFEDIASYSGILGNGGAAGADA